MLNTPSTSTEFPSPVFVPDQCAENCGSEIFIEQALSIASADRPTVAIRPVGGSRAPWALLACSSVLAGFSLLARRPGTLMSLVEQMGIVLLLIVPALVIPVYWHQKQRAERRDAALTIPWALLIIILLKQSILTATAWHFPLRDSLFQRWDARLGINVPAIVRWQTQHHLIGQVLGYSYGMLANMMLCALLLSALLGRRATAERFVLANALGFVVSLPCFLWLPAIGPWVAWHLAASPAQHAWDVAIRGVRSGVMTDGTSACASVCLPSFHAFWAVVSAQAFWSFRWLRIPAAVLAGLMVASTLTTGWHYGVDALAGVVLAAICGTAAWLTVRR